MRPSLRTIGFLAGAASIVAVPSAAHAQTPQAPPKPQEDARPTGLPSRISWTFNFDAGWGTFGFANSYFNNPKDPNVPENLSDQWFEGYVKPSLSATFVLKSTSEIYGKVSVVGERTYGEVPDLYGPDVSSFGGDDLMIGWRSGQSLEAGENLLDFSFGRQPYQLGTGMLIWDGAAEGGSRGGYWTNARRAFALTAIGRVQLESQKIEGFYLDRDELPEDNSDTRLVGVNYEFRHGEHTTIGASYMRFFANRDVLPERDGMHLFNVRADSAPIASAPDLSFLFEYASERNGDLLRSHAWTVTGAYQLSHVAWTPKLSYRYALFQGDDPATAVNEAFDPLFAGFNDWGTWWQGEIAGEYFLQNSNLASHMVQAHFEPVGGIGTGVIVYNFRLDKAVALGPVVTDKHVAVETDWYVDYALNRNFALSFVLAFANPGKAVEQLTGRTKNFSYGMAYIGYHF